MIYTWGAIAVIVMLSTAVYAALGNEVAQAVVASLLFIVVVITASCLIGKLVTKAFK